MTQKQQTRHRERRSRAAIHINQSEAIQAAAGSEYPQSGQFLGL
jgi:hypothetical protein